MKNLSTFAKIFTVLLIVLFALLCALFIPSVAEDIRDKIEPFVTYTAGIVLCTPVAVLLFMALPLCTAVGNDTVFTLKTAKRLSVISLIMFVDCVMLLFAVTAFLIFGELSFFSILALVDLIGFAISVILKIFAGYLGRAASLKEEVDATL